MRYNTRTGRIPALQTCIDRGWKLGDILTSSSWTESRKIAETIPTGIKKAPAGRPVRVFLIRGNGSVSKDQTTPTFPADVQLKAPDQVSVPAAESLTGPLLASR